MTYNELPLTKDIRQALEKVLEYCWKDEEADYLSIPEHERPNEHIYHSLQKIRLALDTTPQRFDIDAFLESRNQIAILWAVEDVQSIRPDLNEEQSWEVLGRAEHIHDCNYGFTWDLLEDVANDLFPLPNKQSEDEGPQ